MEKDGRFGEGGYGGREGNEAISQQKKKLKRNL